MSSFTNQDLRRAGLKVTLPRLKILELLEKMVLFLDEFLGNAIVIYMNAFVIYMNVIAIIFM